MFFYEGQFCPVCNQSFSEKDDIVACPVCGAPHHRDCWKSEGHCHFEAQHGTAEQWSRDTARKTATDDTKKAQPASTRRCPNCGHDNPMFAEFCSHCGGSTLPKNEPDEPDTPFTPPPVFREYAPYHMPTRQNLGGIPRDAVLEDDVTAEDLAAVVGRNSQYYVPTFFRMKQKGTRIRWNWAAFFLTPIWLLFRKSYVCGTLVMLFTVLQSALISVIQLTKLQVLLQADTLAEMYETIDSLLLAGSPLEKYLHIISLLTILMGAVHLFFGLFGNYIYEQTCLARIANAKKKYEGSYKEMLPLLGGVSMGLGFLAYFLWFFTPDIIALILQL